MDEWEDVARFMMLNYDPHGEFCCLGSVYMMSSRKLRFQILHEFERFFMLAAGTKAEFDGARE